jgi:hypothetical protein
VSPPGRDGSIASSLAGSGGPACLIAALRMAGLLARREYAV